MQPKEHYFRNGSPIHHNSCCVFLDVLGFKDRLETSYKDPNPETANDLLRAFNEALQEASKSARDLASDPGSMVHYASFTDNVLYATPLFGQADVNGVFMMAIAATEYQLSMIESGFFVRGGLAVGPLFVDQHTVYGKASVDAYELESKVAVNPVVVLDAAARAILDVTPRQDRDEPQLHDYFLIGPDGHYFVSYLEGYLNVDRTALDDVSLLDHKAAIQKELLSAPVNVKSKFEWLGQYHNYFCRVNSGLKNFSEELLIVTVGTYLEFEELKQAES